VEAGWDDDSAHARFLDQAAVLGALDLAAACYRRKLGAQATQARAQSGLDRAVRLALQLHQASPHDPSIARTARLVKFAGIFVALVLFVATMWVVWVAVARR
jgi:hypothetical protein